MSASLNVTDVARWPGGPFVFMAAEAPHKPSVVDMRRPGHLIAMVTHDSGMSWPDKRGLQLMHAVLAEAGTVVSCSIVETTLRLAGAGWCGPHERVHILSG